METIFTRFYIYNKNNKNVAVVNTEAEAQAIITKNSKRGWTYKSHSWKQEVETPWWALAGYNADPANVIYDFEAH